MKDWAEWFYKGGRWQHTRKEYLDSVGGLCHRCSTDNNPVLALIVHHMVYLTPANIYDDAIAYGWDNLEALCQACHNKEHHGTKETENCRHIAFDECGQPWPVE